VQTVKWKIPALLREHNITPYEFMKATGLSQNAAYALALGAAERVYLETFPKLKFGLEKLTGKTIAIGDLLDFVEEPA
jgi:DNA-binding Xre family transcriptional regulator